MPLEEITQKAGEDIDSPLNPLESIENSNQSRNYLGKAYDYAKTTSDKVASSAKRFWDYKGKKWAIRLQSHIHHPTSSWRRSMPLRKLLKILGLLSLVALTLFLLRMKA